MAAADEGSSGGGGDGGAETDDDLADEDIVMQVGAAIVALLLLESALRSLAAQCGRVALTLRLALRLLPLTQPKVRPILPRFLHLNLANFHLSLTIQ